jgi:hypothetical protein
MRGPATMPRGDRVAQADVDRVARAEVSHRGEPGLERRAREPARLEHPLGGLLLERRQLVGGPVQRGLERQVRVRVDQARQQRRVPELDHARIGRNRHAIAGGEDLAGLDDHDPRPDHAIRLAVVQARRLEGRRRPTPDPPPPPPSPSAR